MDDNLIKFLDKFYELDETDSEKVYDLVLNFAETNRSEFIKHVKSQGFGIDSHRAILYESIMDKAAGWEDFLFDQIRCITNEAESGNKLANDELTSIYYLTNIGGLKKSFYNDAIEYFKSKLNSKNSDVKSAALEYIVDLHAESKLAIPWNLKNRLQAQLFDVEYKIRCNAYLNLKYSNCLPKNFKQKTWDKLRLFFNVERMLVKILTKSVEKKLIRKGN